MPHARREGWKSFLLPSMALGGLALTLGCQSATDLTINLPIVGYDNTTYLEYVPATNSLKEVNVANQSDAPPVAYLPSTTAAGGFTKVTGVWNTPIDPTNLSFTIPASPSGHYWLNASGVYLWTNTNLFDMGNYVGGVPSSSQTYPTVSTPVSFTTTGLPAWDSSKDGLIFMDFNSNTYVDPLELSGGSLAASATSLSGLKLDWFSNPGKMTLPLLNTANGSYPEIIDFADGTSGTETYTAAKAYAFPTPVSITNGASTTIAGTFATSTSAYNLDWNLADFTKPASGVAASPTLTDAFFYYLAVPGPKPEDWQAGNWLPLLWYNPSSLSLGSVSLDNLLVATAAPNWQALSYGEADFSETFTYPGAAAPTTLYGYVVSTTTSALSKTSPLAVTVSPAQSPTIAGKAFTTNPTGVGVNPILQWQAPAKGTPTGYIVWIINLKTGNNDGILVTAAQGPANSLTIPPGVLVAGTYYAVQIRAIVSDQWKPSTASFKGIYPYTGGYADYLTTWFLP